MKSMTIVKRVFSRGLAALALAAAVSAVPAKAGVVAGGTVPVINTIRAIGNTSLDLSAAGTAVPLVTFYMDNNTAGGFTISVTSTNGGFAPPGGLVAAGIAFSVFGIAAPATTSGTLGASVAQWGGTETQAAPAIGTVTSVGTQGVQTTATVDYRRAITASWAAPTTLLAGYYSENFVINLAAIF